MFRYVHVSGGESCEGPAAGASDCAPDNGEITKPEESELHIQTWDLYGLVGSLGSLKILKS